MQKNNELKKQIINPAESTDIKTLEDLLGACEVDEKRWSVADYSITKSDVTQKDGTTTPKFQIRANLEKNEEENSRVILDNFIKEANKHSPKLLDIKKFEENGDILYFVGIFDTHVSKLAWKKETGHEDYDINIASKLYTQSVDYFYNKASKIPKLNRILFPIGNDFFNFDKDNRTTHGTEVASDSRWQKMFKRGCDLTVDAIDKLSKLAPVDVLVIYGNHDSQASQYLGYYIQAWYRNNPNVKINNEPTYRKYYRYGKNLLGFCHGNESKGLALIMSQERPYDWAQTHTKEWFLGHFHHERVEEINGVRVRVLNSISPPDEWHSKKGFVCNHRAPQSFVYDKNIGLTEIHYFNIKRG